MFKHTRARYVISAVAVATAGILVTACGNVSSTSTKNSTSSITAAGMMHMAVPADNGLASNKDGYALVTDSATTMPSQPTNFSFHITAPDGTVQTSFADDQTKLMHFYVIRSDVTGYQHIHPTEGTGSQAGMWTVPLQINAPGNYRVFASFIANDKAGEAHELVLSKPLTVPGTAADTALPTASNTATVDGYTVTLSGQATAGVESALTATVTKDGTPVTDLEQYLNTFAHLTAFKADNLAFIHLHPSNATTSTHGGPALQFMADFPVKSDYRVFMQFQTNGQLHTAQFTVAAH